jgi:hypothetical protein
VITDVRTDTQTNLLIGFDALRLFLRVRWEEDEKRSVDLANLLSSMERDVGRNSQPLDIAQWSDWLDAVLSVRPDLGDVKRARKEIEDDHQRFHSILEMKGSEQERELDKFRTESARQTWHRIGHHPISILEGYEAVGKFLTAYWERGGKRCRYIGTILQDLLREPAASSFAQWNDWLRAVQAAQNLVNR